MINLYIDFDGVIADTIKVTYKMIEDLGIDLTNQDEVVEFYKKLDWYELLANTLEINDAFDNINILEKSKIYKINILTTVCSLEEMKAKVNYIRNKNSNIGVICVPKGADKTQFVNPNNAILIDDFSKNLEVWQKHGGISIKFSDKKENGKYLTISSLAMMLEDNIIDIINYKLQ